MSEMNYDQNFNGQGGGGNDRGMISFNMKEKVLNPPPGLLMLFLNIVGLILSCGLFILGVTGVLGYLSVIIVLFSIALFVICCILFGGLKTVKPNEAMVLTLFGKYYGTIKKPGFFLVNPFATAFNPSRVVTVNANGSTTSVGSKTISL